MEPAKVPGGGVDRQDTALSTEEPPAGNVWLVSPSGPRYQISKDVTRVGRSRDNDIVFQGPDAASVSLQHLEIRRDGDALRVHDLGSTNGTYLNGERITDAEFHPPARIRLGTQGPELSVVIEEPEAFTLDSTQVIETTAMPLESYSQPKTEPFHDILSEAVERARQKRAHGIADQTMTIMRDVIRHAIHHSGKRTRWLAIVLAIGLASVSAGGAWKVARLNRERRDVDRRIHEIELQLQHSSSGNEMDRLISELDVYQGEAERLRRNFIYRMGPQEQDFVTDEIRKLMAEFGSEIYSVPPDFSQRVHHYIDQYQGPDRPNIVRALGSSAGKIRQVRDVLEEEHLPPDLAYVPVVETALDPAESKAGAVGLWQFTPTTARAYGLRVDNEVDERENTLKATRAACKYLRELILDFGSGSSVMLALAAYNSGPSKVKQAVMKIRDPIRQRNFWYLYRTRALPLETREYVPKVVAVMIVGRNARRLGF